MANNFKGVTRIATLDKSSGTGLLEIYRVSDVFGPLTTGFLLEFRAKVDVRSISEFVFVPDNTRTDSQQRRDFDIAAASAQQYQMQIVIGKGSQWTPVLDVPLYNRRPYYQLDLYALLTNSNNFTLERDAFVGVKLFSDFLGDNDKVQFYLSATEESPKPENSVVNITNNIPPGGGSGSGGGNNGGPTLVYGESSFSIFPLELLHPTGKAWVPLLSPFAVYTQWYVDPAELGDSWGFQKPLAPGPWEFQLTYCKGGNRGNFSVTYGPDNLPGLLAEGYSPADDTNQVVSFLFEVDAPEIYQFNIEVTGKEEQSDGYFFVPQLITLRHLEP